jgi:hypothetical protein
VVNSRESGEVQLNRGIERGLNDSASSEGSHWRPWERRALGNCDDSGTPKARAGVNGAGANDLPSNWKARMGVSNSLRNWNGGRRRKNFFKELGCPESWKRDEITLWSSTSHLEVMIGAPTFLSGCVTYHAGGCQTTPRIKNAAAG